ncbi:MFS transporter [Natronosporangium hydrolyticum]|uniref:MFS transporter n=1 Tax=Natronosporangium hydrolyticum TaxID=2811111 RepID=A0A895YNZ5_9ACTN|nr:MFS transporter [Natronosporangium hydrolyticum]QSB15840.1 MFS transporter [Natronosporangium hydrolyticum]
MPSVISVLTRNRDFRRLFFAQVVIFGGDWFAVIPLMALLLDLTGRGSWGTLALAADTGLLALLLPYAGTVADRFDRRKIMMCASAVTLVAVAILLLIREPGVAWLGPVAIGIVGAAKAFYTPAALAALPNLVSREELGVANAVAGGAWGTMLVVGASLGGVMTALLGPYACFLITAGCMVVATYLVWRIRTPLQGERTGAPQPALRAIRESLAYIRQRPRVLSLVTVKSAVGVGNGVLGAFPLLAASFAVGPIGTGLLFAARGAGALAGPFVLRKLLSRRSWLLPGLSLSMAAYGLAYLGVAFSPWFMVTVVLVLVAHFAGGGNWMMSNFALQLEVPDELRGRVFAVDMMLATMAVSASLLIFAALVDVVELRWLIAGAAGATLVYAGVWRLATRRLSRLGDGDDSAATASAVREG